MKRKTEKELKTMGDDRLFNYFKSVRAKSYAHIASFSCACCKEPTWKTTANLSDKERVKLKFKNEKDIDDTNAYLAKVKKELESRNNIVRKKTIAKIHIKHTKKMRNPKNANKSFVKRP